MRIRVHLSEGLQSEDKPEESGGEGNVSCLRGDPNLRLSKCAASLGQNFVDLVNGMSEFVVCVCRGNSEFKRESVDLVDHQHHVQTLFDNSFQKSLCVQHHALKRVDDYHSAVTETHCRSALVRKVHVPWCVENVEQERFLCGVLQHQAHRKRFHRQLSLLLVETCVCVPVLFGGRPILEMSLLYKHVHEKRLPMVQVTHQTDVPNQIWFLHQPRQKFERKGGLRKLLFKQIKILCAHRCYDGFCDRLCVLLLNQGLSTRINIFSVWVELLVFIQSDGAVCHRLFFHRHSHVNHFCSTPALFLIRIELSRIITEMIFFPSKPIVIVIQIPSNVVSKFVIQRVVHPLNASRTSYGSRILLSKEERKERKSQCYDRLLLAIRRRGRVHPSSKEAKTQRVQKNLLWEFA
mmetsp:Transcript_13999/g.27997  ORF Transcript_13999/g.27997 Transcript_13999/m.27997 type:complete len:406 (-) Transcript_13999:78-1295(-)